MRPQKSVLLEEMPTIIRLEQENNKVNRQAERGFDTDSEDAAPRSKKNPVPKRSGPM